MPEQLRYDSIKVRAHMTDDGYLRDTPVIARAGVQEYRRLDGTVRREYRPPEVVFDSESLTALAGIPIIDTHIGVMSASNVRQHAIGTVLSPGRQDSADNNLMVADIVIHDPTPVTRHNRKELSLAYSVRCDETPGTTPDGQPYDTKVVAITRYNHLAIVERGRAGVARLRLDSEDAISSDIENVEILERKDSEDMPTPGENGGNPQPAPVNPPAAPRNMVSIRIDGLEYPASPEVENHIRRLNESITAANRRADTAEAERDSLRTQITQHESQIAQVRNDTAAQVRNRITLEGVAREHGVEVRADATDRAIREEIIRKIDNDSQVRFDGKSEDYVSALFDKALERHAANKKQNETNRSVINGVPAMVAPRADSMTGQPVIPLVPVIRSAKDARDMMQRRGRL